MKKLLILCAGACLLYSCKKEESSRDNYTITGIHDIDFGNQMSDTMSFSVDLIPGGAQEIVDLSVEGLPSDLTATLSKTSGTPAFNSLLTINRQESSGGTHTLNLIGISAGGKRKAYAFRVVLPPLRGIRFDGNYSSVFSAVNDSTSGSIIVNAAQQMNLRLKLPKGLPNSAGTYSYRITAAPPLPGEAQLDFWVGERNFVPGNNGSSKIDLSLDSTGAVTKIYLPVTEVSTTLEPILYRNLEINYNK